MIHPHTRLTFINDVIGFGVVATRRIPRGTITWVRDPLDLGMSAGDVEKLGPLFRAQLDRFSFTDGAGQRILCWDIARYVNHSCDPACLAPGFDFEVAVRDIEVGDQLCDDYGTLNPEEPFECACGSPGCRRTVQPDDHLRLHGEWDARVRAVFPSLPLVEQPLWPLVNQPDLVMSAASGRSPVPSCRTHFGGTSLA